MLDNTVMVRSTFAIFLLFTLASCGLVGSDDSPDYLGTWEAADANADNDFISISEDEFLEATMDREGLDDTGEVCFFIRDREVESVSNESFEVVNNDDTFSIGVEVIEEDVISIERNGESIRYESSGRDLTSVNKCDRGGEFQ